MTDAELAAFRQQLLTLRSELTELSASAADASEPVKLDQASVGRLSRMDAMQNQAMAQETERRRQRTLLKVEGALRRIDRGDFGYCFGCGDDLDPRRLQADPTTTRCVDCQTAT